MSLNIRAHPHDASSNTRSSSRSRKVIIGFLIILTLFLIGTVIVLSSVSYYLGIPTSAYLTEDEVAWSPAHVIKPLLYEPEGSAIQHRRRNDTLPSASTIDEDWIQMEDQLEAEEDLEDPAVEPTAHTSSADSVSMLASDGEWDVDGRGSGNYWMKANWDGHVDGTHDWTRLFNVSTRQGETIPRLIHQTWKNDILPPKWRKAWKECREGMPDYEYMLWTDETAREFVKTFYPAHLHMYDSYKYPIQRADSIRYFVLHHFGGVYMDLDIGCRRRLDPLLQGDWDTILPITKPVGVSNDLIFSAKGSAFMDDVVHALPAWNHEWVSNYPTVMFSTGPMFVSGQYAIYSSAHPITDVHPRAEVRILPKSLYGKNAPMATVPHSFFSHFYGSSWHADDAGFITFLGSWGKKLMYVGAVVIVLGILRLIYQRYTKSSPQYQLMSILPTASSSSTHSGSTTPPLGSSYSASSSPYSPTSGFDNQQLPSEIASAFKRAGNLILAAPATLLHGDRRNARRRNGLLYFVPAAFLPTTTGRGRTASEASQLPLRRPRRQGSGPLGSGVKTSGKEVPPPPYERESMDTPQFGERSASPIPMKTLGSAFHEEDIDIYSRDGESSSTSEFDVEGPEEDGDWAAWDEGKTTPRR